MDRRRKKVSVGNNTSDRNRQSGVELFAFNLVAAAFARAGMPGRSEGLLLLMRRAQVRPDEAGGLLITTSRTAIGA
jgi:pentatricopeptide repeat protein